MIIVKDFLNMAFSYEDGMKLREKINIALQTEKPVEVDFEGINVFTTMFFNACFGHFVFTNSIEWYNEMIKVINLNQMGIETHKHSIENAQKRKMEQSTDAGFEVTQKTINENA